MAAVEGHDAQFHAIALEQTVSGGKARGDQICHLQIPNLALLVRRRALALVEALLHFHASFTKLVSTNLELGGEGAFMSPRLISPSIIFLYAASLMRPSALKALSLVTK